MHMYYSLNIYDVMETTYNDVKALCWYDNVVFERRTPTYFYPECPLPKSQELNDSIISPKLNVMSNSLTSSNGSILLVGSQSQSQSDSPNDSLL